MEETFNINLCEDVLIFSNPEDINNEIPANILYIIFISIPE